MPHTLLLLTSSLTLILSVTTQNILTTPTPVQLTQNNYSL